MRNSQVLKDLLKKPGIVVCPGIYDGVSARIVENLGFQCAYLTGYGVSAALLGQPDYGMVTLTEIAACARNLTKCLSIPVIADADTGYGNALNVKRTVEEYELAGVAAVQLEDQLYPKRCGHMEDKLVIPMEENIKKIEMAADTRKEMLIIARTDARAPLGTEEAIRRAKTYRKAGADIIFIDAPQSVEEMKRFAEEVDAPLMANMTEGGKTPLLKEKELAEMGYKVVIYPVTGLYAAAKAISRVYARLKEENTSQNLSDQLMLFHEFNEMIGLAEMRALEKHYAPRN